MAQTAAIFGAAGPVLSRWERDFFRDSQPWGFILFARNIAHPAQLARLCADLRDAVGTQAPILIDQEGGRVQRMGPPFWQAHLPALDQMRHVQSRGGDPMRAHWLRNRLIAAELHACGIDVNCAPLADLVEPATHKVLRNRLYGGDVTTVVAAARACAAAFLAGGVLPVLKHIPGYGRAAVDSHLALPRVSAAHDSLHARDFAPFRALSDLRMGMTAHIVFDAIDPTAPATTSAAMISLIRQDIGFDGLLMTDDISMQALSGDVATRSAAAISAGCDLVLHCNGHGDEMARVATAAGPLSAGGQRRAAEALAQRKKPDPVDIPSLKRDLAALIG